MIIVANVYYFRELLERKENEIENLSLIKQELQNEKNIMNEKNEKYQELLVNEKNILESTKQSKIESEKYLKRMLNEYKNEFERKERELNQTLKELKKQCDDMTKEIILRTTQQNTIQSENEILHERCLKLEKRKKEVQTELIVLRNQYEIQLREYDNKILQYQVSFI